jgi:hypothetical protein
MAKSMPAANAMSVTKAGDDEITVRFSEDLPGLKRLKPGEEIPAEYLHAILNFHIERQDERGKVDPRHVRKMKAYW